jgi:MFS transporter, FSR family, fosmidomycin resistance protein
MKQQHIALLSFSHIVMDMNQGALPALLPFLITRHNLSYTAAAGIVFAANISSSLIQPLFGFFAERLSRSWLIPVTLLIAAAGISFTGIAPNYWLIFALVAFGGLGVAAFHPEAARLANIVAGEKKVTAMSIFVTGGYLGFAIGPLVTTALLLLFDLKGTLCLMVPATVMALVFARTGSRLSTFRKDHETTIVERIDRNRDAWGPFGRLSLTVISRAIIFFALNTFLPLYWIDVLHQSKAAGGMALSVFFTAGVIGTILGGRCADRFGYRKVVLGPLIALSFILPIWLFVHNVLFATLLLVPIGFLLFGSFSPLVVMGQKYLPNHVGLASGVTLGLAVTVGGITAPLLGRIADGYGIRSALMAVVFLPIVSTCLAFTLPTPETISVHKNRSAEKRSHNEH